MQTETREPASWEKTLRYKLAFICMAAVAGKEGDLKYLTEDMIEFCRTLSGANEVQTR